MTSLNTEAAGAQTLTREPVVGGLGALGAKAGQRLDASVQAHDHDGSLDGLAPLEDLHRPLLHLGAERERGGATAGDGDLVVTLGEGGAAQIDLAAQGEIAMKSAGRGGRLGDFRHEPQVVSAHARGDHRHRGVVMSREGGGTSDAEKEKNQVSPRSETTFARCAHSEHIVLHAPRAPKKVAVGAGDPNADRLPASAGPAE